MPFRSRGIARDLSAALAVLLVYALTLLVPLHQAAALQRDLGALGFVATEWSICTPLAQSDETPTAVKCPIASVAKGQFAAITPDPIVLVVERVSDAVLYAHVAASRPAMPRSHDAQARAPPEAV